MLNLAVLDCLVGNVDRHTRNFGLFYNSSTGKYEIPLIFDNGMGLFEHDYYRDNYRNYEEAMNNVYVSPYGEDPFELAMLGVSYGSFVRFFQRRIIREGCILYREHLRALGMDKMDFDLYIRKNNGNNHLDNYWVKFDDGGAQSFAELH